jgi:hypothetical protein
MPLDYIKSCKCYAFFSLSVGLRILILKVRMGRCEGFCDLQKNSNTVLYKHLLFSQSSVDYCGMCRYASKLKMLRSFRLCTFKWTELLITLSLMFGTVYTGSLLGN